MELFSASDAYKQSYKISEEKNQQKWSTIVQMIDNACKRGDYEVEYTGYLGVKIKEKLVSLGYTIVGKTYRNEDFCTIISWAIPIKQKDYNGIS